MRVILGVPFLILTILFFLCTLYCVIMAFAEFWAWGFIGIGTLLPGIVAGRIAHFILTY